MSWRLIQGDALGELARMPADSYDAIITDPPYSSGGLAAGSRIAEPAKKYQQGGTLLQFPTFSGDNRDQRSWAFWCLLWLQEAYRVAAPGAPILLFCDWRQLPLTTDLLQAAGFIWRGIVPWDKTECARPQLGRFSHQAEYVAWGSKGRMPLQRGVGPLPGLYRHRTRRSDRFHLTGKPTPLMADLVKITRPGGHILDPFNGSGTTGVAALQAGFSYTGIERESAYIEISTPRLIEAEAEALARSAA